MTDLIKFAFRDIPSAGVAVFVLLVVALLISETVTKICTVIFINKAAVILQSIDALKKAQGEPKE